MHKALQYLYDPLCGWCYGAGPTVSALLETPGVSFELLPTGLFSGEGARVMDDEFAAFAWSNDQRIEGVTGQHFSDAYRHQVLADREHRFDSGPATLAMTAVALTDASREWEVLKAIQHARYVEGSDVTSLSTLASLLKARGLSDAASMIEHSDVALVNANSSRIGRARVLMQEFGVPGVPQLVLHSDVKRILLSLSAAYSNPGALLDQLQAA